VIEHEIAPSAIIRPLEHQLDFVLDHFANSA